MSQSQIAIPPMTQMTPHERAEKTKQLKAVIKYHTEKREWNQVEGALRDLYFHFLEQEHEKFLAQMDREALRAGF